MSEDITPRPAQPVTDNGGSLTVDDGAGSLTVDGTVGVNNFPASQPVTDNGGTLTVDDGGTTLSVDDGGGSLTVDGTVAISGTVTTTGGGGGTEFAEDAAHTNGDLGKLLLAVRRDTGAAFTSTDGDYTAIAADSNGRVKVVQDQALPAGANVIGVVTIQDGGNVISIDDGAGSITVDGPLTDTQLRATAVPVSGTVTANAGTGPFPVSDNGGSLTVDNGGTFAVQADTELPAAAALADTTSNPTVPGVGAFGLLWNGTNWDRSKGDATNGQWVNIKSSVALGVTGTFWQATQPVSIASAVPVTDNSGSLTIDSTQLPAALAANGGLKIEGVASGVAVPVSGTFWQATQPVSGTVTANAGTGTMAVSLSTLPSLVAGTAYVGKVRQTDGTLDLSLLNSAPGSDTGQVAVPVRVISSLAAAGGGGTQYVEDVALGSTPTGTLSIARRVDTLGTVTPIVDDAVSMRVNNRGALWTKHDGTMIVDGSGVTQPVSGTVTATASGDHTVVGKAAQGAAVAGNPVLIAGWDPSSNVLVPKVFSASGDSFGPLESWSTVAYNYVYNGTSWDRIRGDTTNGLDVDVTRLPALPAGTNNIGDVDVLTMPVVQVGDNSGSLTVDAPVGTPAFVRLSDGAAAITTLPVSLAALPGTFAEDAVVNSGDLGSGVLARRLDDAQAAAALTNADGDYTHTTADSKGRQKVTITGEGYATVTGNLTASGAGTDPQTASSTSVVVVPVSETGNLTVQVSGTYGAGAVLVFEGSVTSTGTGWAAVAATREDTQWSEYTTRLPANTTRQWTISVPGYKYIRIRCSTFVSGTLAITANPGGWLAEPIIPPLPTGRVIFGTSTLTKTVTTTDAVPTADLVPTRDYVASAAVASVTVTAGKRLRLTNMTVAMRAAGTPVAAGFTARLRVNPAGAAVVTSPIVAEASIGSTAALAVGAALSQSTLLDAELNDAAQFTISVIGVASSANTIYDVTLQGYEY